MSIKDFWLELRIWLLRKQAERADRRLQDEIAVARIRQAAALAKRRSQRACTALDLARLKRARGV